MQIIRPPPTSLDDRFIERMPTAPPSTMPRMLPRKSPLFGSCRSCLNLSLVLILLCPPGTAAAAAAAYRSRRSRHLPSCFAFPNNDSDSDSTGLSSKFQDVTGNLSRRDLLLIGTGGVAYAKLVGDAVSRIARGNAYPAAHEDRVRNTFQLAMVEAARAVQLREGGNSFGNPDGGPPRKRPLRVLEIGIGSEARVATRGLYGGALDELLLLSSGGGTDKLSSSMLAGVEIVGVDMKVPVSRTKEKAREQLSHPSGCILPSFQTTLDVVEGNIVEGLPQYPSGWFDSIVCALTLCSVSDQKRALDEICRLVNPNGGTFGFVEHCAVRLDEKGEADKAFLEWQQRTLDPLQQLVADNCHLHRDTDLAIYDVFGVNDDGRSTVLWKERFLVDEMWPVSCQCSGVVQRVEI